MRPVLGALVAGLAGGAGLVACTGYAPRGYIVDVPLGLPLYAAVPEGSSLTRERVQLGERLFGDPLLSVDLTVSCASCHRPDHSFADDTPVSPGVRGRRGQRNTPSLLNVAYARHLTWDGRSSTLEELVLKPIQDPVEMDLSLAELVERLESARGYPAAFERAFDGPISIEGIALALAAYLRTLRSGDAPIDRVTSGENAAFDQEQREGFRLFVGKARCSFCHTGPLLSDAEFHNTGVTARTGTGDQGRFTRTGEEADRRAFRTPSLRNVAITAPYMHDGSLATLQDVVDFYDDGGGPDALLDAEIRPLHLTDDEKFALVSFLRGLGGTSP